MALRIALFGQAPFGKDVLGGLLDAGHEIVGVSVPPDRGRPDPLAAEAEAGGLHLLRHRRFRRQGVAIPERVAEYRALGAELNVLAFVTAFLPLEILDAPRHRSLCFHPSLLPRFRGGAAIPWQIILGERESGVTVFQPDDGVDTGPVIVQRGGISIEKSDTAGSLYFDKLYPLGVEALLEAVQAVDAGAAQLRPQDETHASHQGLVDDEVARIDWSRPVEELDRLLRGCDPQPGAHTRLGERQLRFYDVARVDGEGGEPPGTVLRVGPDGLVVAARGGELSVGRVRLDGGAKRPAAEAGAAPGDRLS